MAQIIGGDRVAAALQEISRMLGDGGGVRVGFLERATYPDGTPVAAVAAWQNYGTGTIPPRPFFSNMVAAKSPEWGAAIGGLLVANNYNLRRVLELTGAAIQGQLKESIIQTNAPPLAPSTIKRKGFSKPLIDTSHMINSVDYEVEIR